LKTKELDLKLRREKYQHEIEGLKAELEGVRQKKRDIISDFRRRERDYKEHKETREPKMKKIKEDEVKMETKPKETCVEYSSSLYPGWGTHVPTHQIKPGFDVKIWKIFIYLHLDFLGN
jgi:hypothetical protein